MGRMLSMGSPASLLPCFLWFFGFANVSLPHIRLPPGSALPLGETDVLAADLVCGARCSWLPFVQSVNSPKAHGQGHVKLFEPFCGIRSTKTKVQPRVEGGLTAQIRVKRGEKRLARTKPHTRRRKRNIRGKARPGTVATDPAWRDIEARARRPLQPGPEDKNDATGKAQTAVSPFPCPSSSHHHPRLHLVRL